MRAILFIAAVIFVLLGFQNFTQGDQVIGLLWLVAAAVTFGATSVYK